MTLKEIEITIHQSLNNNKAFYNQMADLYADRKIKRLEHKVSLLVDDDLKGEQYGFLMEELEATRRILSEPENLEYARILRLSSPEMLTMFQDMSESDIRSIYEDQFRIEHNLDTDEIGEVIEILQEQGKQEFKTEFDRNIIAVLAHEKYYDYLKSEKEMLDEIMAISLDDMASAGDIQYNIENIKPTTEPYPEQTEPSKGATTAQQVLLMHYFFEAVKTPTQRTKAAKARVLKALTAKNADSIRECLENPLEFKHKATQKANLEYIRKFFVELRLDNIVAEIDKDLRSIQ